MKNATAQKTKRFNAADVKQAERLLRSLAATQSRFRATFSVAQDVPNAQVANYIEQIDSIMGHVQHLASKLGKRGA